MELGGHGVLVQWLNRNRHIWAANMASLRALALAAPTKRSNVADQRRVQVSEASRCRSISLGGRGRRALQQGCAQPNDSGALCGVVARQRIGPSRRDPHPHCRARHTLQRCGRGGTKPEGLGGRGESAISIPRNVGHGGAVLSGRLECRLDDVLDPLGPDKM